MTEIQTKGLDHIQLARIQVVLGERAAARDPEVDHDHYVNGAVHLLGGSDIAPDILAHGVKPELLSAAYRHFADNPDQLEAEIAKRWPKVST